MPFGGAGPAARHRVAARSASTDISCRGARHPLRPGTGRLRPQGELRPQPRYTLLIARERCRAIQSRLRELAQAESLVRTGHPAGRTAPPRARVRPPLRRSELRAPRSDYANGGAALQSRVAASASSPPTRRAYGFYNPHDPVEVGSSIIAVGPPSAKPRPRHADDDRRGLEAAGRDPSGSRSRARDNASIDRATLAPGIASRAPRSSSSSTPRP